MKPIKIQWLVMVASVALGLGTVPVQAQAPVITGLGRNGELVCTNLLAGSTASVVWTSSVLEPWTNSPPGLAAVKADTSGSIRVTVPLLSVIGPMFYRVRGYAVPTNFVAIPAGTFTMGSPTNEPARNADETQHTVTLTKGFCLGRFEVTQAEYLAVMGSNPSYFQDSNLSVDQVSWDDAVDYCTDLTSREQSAGRLPTEYVYRLPTESEWEYACRAGTTSVGSYEPNAWGLYDMHRSVWEWCQDWYGTYPSGSVSDPQGAPPDSYRVLRGGWSYGVDYCRSAQRGGSIPASAHIGFGFRVVLAQGQ